MKISIDNHSYYNFKEIRGYINFMHHPSELLKNTLEDFFSVEVNYNFSPLLDNDLLALIQNNPKRNVYVDNNNQVSLLITVNPISDAHYLFVIQLKNFHWVHSWRFFHLSTQSYHSRSSAICKIKDLLIHRRHRNLSV